MIIVIGYVMIIIIYGCFKKINLLNSFNHGIKDNYSTLLTLLPNIMFLTLGLNIFTSSGIIEIIESIVKNISFLDKLVIPELLIQAILRPISNSSSLIIMTEIFEKYGPNSLVGQFSSILQVSSDTTLYILMIYFSSIKITKIGKCLSICLITNILTFLFVFLMFFFFNKL